MISLILFATLFILIVLVGPLSKQRTAERTNFYFCRGHLRRYIKKAKLKHLFFEIYNRFAISIGGIFVLVYSCVSVFYILCLETSSWFKPQWTQLTFIVSRFVPFRFCLLLSKHLYESRFRFCLLLSKYLCIGKIAITLVWVGLFKSKYMVNIIYLL